LSSCHILLAVEARVQIEDESAMTLLKQLQQVGRNAACF
jgi:hypothetical protein